MEAEQKKGEAEIDNDVTFPFVIGYRNKLLKLS